MVFFGLTGEPATLGHSTIGEKGRPCWRLGFPLRLAINIMNKMLLLSY